MSLPVTEQDASKADLEVTSSNPRLSRPRCAYNNLVCPFFLFPNSMTPHDVLICSHMYCEPKTLQMNTNEYNPVPDCPSLRIFGHLLPK